MRLRGDCRLAFMGDPAKTIVTATALGVLAIGTAYAGAYTPPAGSPERKAIVT